jgi:hypothetical protein
LKINNKKERKPRKDAWTEGELKILREKYESMSISEFRERYLPSRTEISIMCKANKIGLSSRRKWTPEENKILIEVYESMLNEDIKNTYLPNRTVKAIQDQGKNLGLKKLNARREYDEEELITHLKNYANELGRTPSGDDMKANKNIPSLSTYVRYFGNYSIACKEAGLDINCLRLFGKDSWYYASNGDLCLSKAELSITEYLIENNIKYEKEVYYSDFIEGYSQSLKRCDWLVKLNNESIVIEYFGMPEKPYYKRKMDFKIDLCKRNNIKLIDLYRKDLSDLDKKLKTLTKQNP